MRTHGSYDPYNVCKMGKTFSIPERDCQYATGEYVRGSYQCVYEVSYDKTNMIERELQMEFKEYHRRDTGGTEFYDCKIIEMIEPYLKRNGVEYRSLTMEEVRDMIRFYRIRKIMNHISIRSLIEAIKRTYSERTPPCDATKKSGISPREDQEEIIQKTIEHFEEVDKGMLVLMCGVGKTLISLWSTHRMGLKRILIGVPNILLLTQWKMVITRVLADMYSAENSLILTIYGSVTEREISHYMGLSDTMNRPLIMITTYASSYKVLSVCQKKPYQFDMKIQDECHHLTADFVEEVDESDIKKSFIHMLRIPSKKQISLTATLKLLDGSDDPESMDMIISNDSIKHFGEIIDRKSLLWAIEKGVICDYDVQTIITEEDQAEEHFQKFNVTEDVDKRLFLSAFAALKSIYDGHSHHLLIYTNNMENSSKTTNYIELLIDRENGYFGMDLYNERHTTFYHSDYHSGMSTMEQREILRQFEGAKRGILTCVYCLGEGWDLPLLDGVVFAETMTSNIRIVQSALRGARKNRDEPAKKAKIILPLLNRENWLDGGSRSSGGSNTDMKKIREVIYQMGLEDETIEHKIKVYKSKVQDQNQDPLKKPSSGTSDRSLLVDETDEDEYDEELTQQLRLKTVGRAALDITYEKAVKIIAEKKVTSKEEYYQLCDRDYRLTKEPEVVYMSKFTNWVDYLSIKRTEYYDYETCKAMVCQYIRISPSLMDHYLDLSRIVIELVAQDPKFPPIGLWADYYKCGKLSDIIDIESIRKLIYQKKQSSPFL